MEEEGQWGEEGKSHGGPALQPATSEVYSGVIHNGVCFLGAIMSLSPRARVTRQASEEGMD